MAEKPWLLIEIRVARRIAALARSRPRPVEWASGVGARSNGTIDSEEPSIAAQLPEMRNAGGREQEARQPDATLQPTPAGLEESGSGDAPGGDSTVGHEQLALGTASGENSASRPTDQPLSVRNADDSEREIYQPTADPQPSPADPEQPGSTPTPETTPTADSRVADMTSVEIANAQAALRDAQARMVRARTSFIIANIANAQAAVRTAEAKLQRAQAESVPAADIANAEAAVHAAEAKLQHA